MKISSESHEKSPWLSCARTEDYDCIGELWHLTRNCFPITFYCYRHIEFYHTNDGICLKVGEAPRRLKGLSSELGTAMRKSAGPPRPIVVTPVDYYR